MEKRPAIATIKTGKELRRWYWLKEELVAYCKIKDIGYAGGKFTILERIANKLDGKKVNAKKSIKAKSVFDWHGASLTPNTVITDNYKNSQNVRRFFKVHCGEKFHFSIPFMDWMKANTGKKLKDAVIEWKRLQKVTSNKAFRSVIPEHNQYKQYIRDFFSDNPGKVLKDARHYWKLKRQLPLERHRYERSDLMLK
jgi:site-specific DNA-cytosine methylase